MPRRGRTPHDVSAWGAGWNWDALEGLPRSGELGGTEPGGSRVVQSGWAPVSAAPAYAAAESPACAPVRVTVTSAAAPAPAPMLHAALPSGSLAALNAWRAAAGGAPPRPPSQALPFGAVSQRFHPTTPPANAWRLRAEAFGAPAAPPAPAPSAPAAPAPQPPAPVRVLRSKRKRAGRGRTQDADYVFYDEDEAPPALRGQRRAGARESPDAAGEERDALAGRAVSERPEPLGKQRQRAAGGGTASVAAPAGVGPVTPAAPAVLPAAAGGKQARPPAAEVARAYQEHEVVWARLPGFPWWPAQARIRAGCNRCSCACTLTWVSCDAG